MKLVIDGGLSIPEVGRRLSLAPSTLSNWVSAYKEGKLEEDAKKHREWSEKEMELHRLKRELAEVQMERDVLKEAAALLAKGSL